MPFNLGMGEMIVILVVALLVFGSRLPEVGRSLGRGLVEFKKGLQGTAADLMSEDEAEKEPADPETEEEEAGEKGEKEASPTP